jgi:hypothetical protein
MTNLLYFGVCVAGLVACLVYRRHAPQALTIAAISLAALVAITLLQSFVEPIIYRTLGPQRQGGLLVSNALGAIGFLTGVVRAAALGGLIVAVLADRRIDFQKIGQ